MTLKVAAVAGMLLLAGCGGLSGESTPTPTETVETPPPDTQEPTDTPQSTVTDTPTEDTPTDTPTEAPPTEHTETATWPPYDFGSGSSDIDVETNEPPAVNASGSGNASAK